MLPQEIKCVISINTSSGDDCQDAEEQDMSAKLSVRINYFQGCNRMTGTVTMCPRSGRLSIIAAFLGLGKQKQPACMDNVMMYGHLLCSFP